MCHDDARAIKAVDSVVKLMAGMFIRVRSRNHYGKQMDRQQKEKSRDDLTKVFIRALHAGSFQERLFSLMTFGIPVHLMPTQVDGTIDLKQHKLWLDQRRALEAIPRVVDHNKVTCVIPSPKDILFGRDKIAQSHPGNVRFLHLIAALQQQYDSANSKEQRFVISSGIVLSIKEVEGRFLKCDDHGWTVVDDKTARFKVTNAFRSHRRKQNANVSKKEALTSEKRCPKRKDQY